ncbi:MAG TPA: hypothetical protein VFY84_12665 [Jiangellales bacterium]|nr:hypothetical protein [Jiangellales bacterium]
MTDSLWRVCADCGDWIWPAEPVFTDTLGRSPICAVCNVRAAHRALASKSTEGDTT